MKRAYAVILALMLLCASLPAFAEAADAPIIISDGSVSEEIRIGQQVKIPDACTFTVCSANAYDTFMGVDAGAAMQHLVLGVDITNMQIGDMVVSSEVTSQLTYDDEPLGIGSKLFMSPLGWYDSNDKENELPDFLTIYHCSESGELYLYYPHYRGRYNSGYSEKRDTIKSNLANKVSISIKGQHGDVISYDPIRFEWRYMDAVMYSLIGSKPTVLEPLVQRRYYYVFTVPDIIARDDGLRTVEFIIGDRSFALTF